MAVRNSLLEKFSGNFGRCWKILHRFSGSAKCYPCQGLGTFRQGKRLLENWPRLRECCWIFSSETATAFLSSSDLGGGGVLGRAGFWRNYLCLSPFRFLRRSASWDREVSKPGGFLLFLGKGPDSVADPFEKVPCRCFLLGRERGKGPTVKISEEIQKNPWPKLLQNNALKELFLQCFCYLFLAK